MVFGQAWLDASNVVVGTKCNSLLRLNVDSGEFGAIELDDGADDTGQNSVPGQGHPCGIHAVALNPSRTLLATGAPDSSECAVFETNGFRRKQVFQVRGCGGHLCMESAGASVNIGDDCTLNMCQITSCDAMGAAESLAEFIEGWFGNTQGHKDWIFGIDWIDDECFVTGRALGLT